jgi:signal transduction histidine kinase
VIAALLVVTLPIGATAAITQYHLYDIDRLLSRALTWLLLSAVVGGSYATVVLAVGGSIGNRTGHSQIASVVATLAAVSIVTPAHRFLQKALDRRFQRRRFDAVRLIHDFIRDPAPATTIEAALQAALGEPSLRVAYWVDDRQCWVDHEGRTANVRASSVRLRRFDALVAAVTVDPEVDGSLLASVVEAARPELENACLRAAITLQLVEVQQSRARIVAAQLAERHRIERNLHDGAQQRLLALALQLRAAEVSDDPARSRSAIEAAIPEIRIAITDLRDLASGLYPPLLTEGGLASALEDLAIRHPTAVHLQTGDERYSPELETAAWFIACEAVANAVKHAQPANIIIEAKREGSNLVVRVEDDGLGGADRHGHGLEGIADRAEAVGGFLTVRDRPGGGTAIRAELPCGS